MADQPKVFMGSPAAEAGSSTFRVAVNTADMTTHYANFFRLTGGAEELYVELGFLTGQVQDGGPEPIKMAHRAVMTMLTAKRLAVALNQTVARYEQTFGVLDEPKRSGTPPAGTPPAPPAGDLPYAEKA